MSPIVLLVAQVLLVTAGVVAAWVVATRRLPAPWSAVGWGALTFPLSQVARFAVLVPLGLVLTPLLGERYAAVNVVLLVLTSGLFEESARWIVLRHWARRVRSRADGVAFGLGHGGVEAILVLGTAAVNGVVLLAGADTIRGTVAAQAPASLPALDAQIDALRTLDLLGILPGMWERVVAIAVHVALTLVVLRAVRERRWAWWAVAVVLHCLFNAAALGLAGLGHVWATEAALTGVAAALVWAVFRGPLRAAAPAAV